MAKFTEEERRKYLGGSDAAAALGLSRWKSPLRLWAEKTGQIEAEVEETVAMRLGNKLEATVAEFFTEETGKKVRRVNETIPHPQHSFLAANIDRRVVGEESILECKTASAWKAKEWQGEEIPQEYIVQVMHYLAVMGAQRGYIAVLIGNQDFKWKTIERDEIVIRQMIDKEVAFWNNFVIPKVMPMQISASDAPTLYELFPLAESGSLIELDDDANKLIETRNAMIQDKISLEEQIKRQENEIRALLKEAESGESSHFKVTWKNQRVAPFLDTERLKADGIYPKYELKNEGRVLRITERKVK